MAEKKMIKCKVGVAYLATKAIGLEGSKRYSNRKDWPRGTIIEVTEEEYKALSGDENANALILVKSAAPAAKGKAAAKGGR